MAYNNKSLIVDWIYEELSKEVGINNDKALLVMDITGFYKIKAVFNALDKYNINRVMILSGLTPLL